MQQARLLRLCSLGLGCAIVLAAATQPRALSSTQGGVWEITGIPGATGAVRRCVAETAELARVERRNKGCTQVVITDDPASAVIHYTCSNGGFGRSKLTLITPRSLRVETQGIAVDAPFNFTAQVRRVGDCRAH